MFWTETLLVQSNRFAKHEYYFIIKKHIHFVKLSFLLHTPVEVI